MARFLDSVSAAITTAIVPDCSGLTYQGPPLLGKKCTVDLTSSTTWTSPYTGEVVFEVWGAGGGGGAHCCCDCGHNGPSGAGGGFASYRANVTTGESYTVVVGRGGMVTTVGNCYNHNCCYGGAGGTSYVTGPALTGITLCATGGDGGSNNCSFGYGGSTAIGGIGYATGAAAGKAITASGHNSGFSSYQYSCYCFHNKTLSGGSPGTNNSQPQGSDWYWHSQIEGSNSMSGTWGMYPGGGGTTPATFCSCYCMTAGTGADGLVRIKW